MWLLAVLIPMSGCVGSQGPDSADSDVLPTAPEPDNDQGTCALGGVVMDDEGKPLSLARVRIIHVDEEEPTGITESARDGSFSFSFIDPGVYQLLAHHGGYIATQELVECVEGKRVTGLDLYLPQAPPLNQPWPAYREFHDVIGCSVGLPVADYSVPDYCASSIPSTGTWHFAMSTTHDVEFEVEPRPDTLTGLSYELKWDPSYYKGGEHLVLFYPLLRADNVTVEASHEHTNRQITGPSPLWIRAESTNPDQALLAPGVHSWEVLAASGNQTTFLNDPLGDSASGVLVYQEFWIYAGFFYNGYPIPEESLVPS